MKKISIIIVIVAISQCFCSTLNAQSLKGSVNENGDDGVMRPIVGAVLQWKSTPIGTVSDINGTFEIARTNTDTLIVIYQAYKNDTIIIPKEQALLNILLSSAHSLAAVDVTARDGSYISVQPILTTVISNEGLRKAACCNLSESFESSVAVDVEYSDAVTGAKQISMLGLAGIYSQILLENVPFVRLLSNQFGLGFVPGTWMEAISVSKGISSVSNGYEAISGQVNVDFKKPETNREKLFFNLFCNSMGKGELNLNSRFDVGSKKNVSSMLLLHTEGQFAKIDMNKDGFLDVPINYQVNAMNRWDYKIPGKFEGRTWLSYLWEDRKGGQKQFNAKTDFGSDSLYGINIKTNKLDVVTKNGFLLKGEDESIGSILSFTYHDNQSYFGLREYKAQQLSGYLNLLYSNRYGKQERSKLTVGISAQFDHLNEELNYIGIFQEQQSPELSSLLKDIRNEMVPGIFVEYSYSIADKLVVMPGMRLDYNFAYKKLFWTPRLHIKWQAAKNSSFRFSAGKGYRVSNVIIENLSLLVSNRSFINGEAERNGSLQPEEAYNAGISFVQSFQMPGGKSSFSIDYYYTYFINQTIIDLDRSTHAVYIYNLNGSMNGSGNKSYSHSVQAELILNPLKRFEITLAYRYNDVKQTTNNNLQQKTLMSPHKALINLSYATKYDKWKFNIALQYHGRMRLPDTRENVDNYQLPEKSPSYLIMNAQVTKKYRGWEFYVGGENLLNYKQKNPILSADDPFGEYFDASVIYAPITGIMGYLGFRYTLK